MTANQMMELFAKELALLRISHSQYPLKSPKDQEIERGFMKRDLERLEGGR